MTVETRPPPEETHATRFELLPAAVGVLDDLEIFLGDAGAGPRPVRGPDRHRPYLGTSDQFDNAIVGFAARYAEQKERDYTEFVKAIRSERLQTVEGV